MFDRKSFCCYYPSKVMKKVIILGAGLGTRLYPITHEIPKPLLPVQGRPILNHQVELFKRYGISEFGIVVLRQDKKKFEQWLKVWEEELPRKNIHFFYQDRPMGTFGALYPAHEWVGDETFLVSNGDDLKDIDLGKLIEKHEEHNPVITMAFVPVPDSDNNYGVPIMEGDMIRGFLEKPQNQQSKFISAGLYVVDPAVFDYVDSADTFADFETDIFPRVAREGKLAGINFEDARLFDCGTLERWERAIKEW